MLLKTENNATSIYVLHLPRRRYQFSVNNHEGILSKKNYEGIAKKYFLPFYL